MLIKELFPNDIPNLENYLAFCGVKDIESFLEPNFDYYDSWEKYDNMLEGVKEIKYQYLTQDSKIFIIQDGDTDGLCSTYMIFDYLINLRNDWNIKILLHTSKQRGLDDEDIMTSIRNERPNLVIVPDAGTNNYLQAEELCEMGIGLLCIDHHDLENPIEKGILINNQIESNNVQRYGSGALVTHKFLTAMDYEFKVDWSKKYIDIVALSLVSDSMNMTSLENRLYYHYGIETKECINNEFLKLMFDKFITTEEYTQKDIAFKIVPKFNSICRCQDQELKKKLMLAFLGMEDLAEVLKICENAHKEQIDKVAKITEILRDEIETKKDSNIVIIASKSIPRSYSGLVCGKVMNLSNKPSIVGSIKNGYFIGSLRSPIPLRDDLAKNPLVDFCSGHPCSAGFGIKEENIEQLVEYYNALTMDYTPCITVLKSYPINSIPNKLFGLYEPYNALWGKEIDQPKFHIHNITFNPSEVKIMGKDKRSLKIVTDKADIMIFRATKEDKVKLGLGYLENETFVLDPKQTKMTLECIGTFGINVWGNKRTNQIIVENYEAKEKENRNLEDLF